MAAERSSGIAFSCTFRSKISDDAGLSKRGDDERIGNLEGDVDADSGLRGDMAPSRGFEVGVSGCEGDCIGAEVGDQTRLNEELSKVEGAEVGIVSGCLCPSEVPESCFFSKFMNGRLFVSVLPCVSSGC